MYDKIAQEPGGGEQFFNCFLQKQDSVIRRVLLEAAFEDGACDSFIGRIWVPENFWLGEFEKMYINQ